ncbi:MAG: glycosyltransferase family 39 protein [Candidatus Latescibacteria bacterium]|nr:glycosyltransferase family 39 protein [Candidatus Latescibacterota bacterium]
MTRTARLWLWAGLVGLSLGLRLYLLNWGLPFVFEEAVPLKKAWYMWRWGQSTLHLDPEFFNYPSLTLYLHLALQGAVFGVQRLAGMVDSATDFAAHYVVDPSAVMLAGRALQALFGAATVALAWPLGRRHGGALTAAGGAALLALSTTHIARSQMIEVDVPLTCFTLLTLLALLRAAERPSLRAWLAAGAAMGLAASTKYTGALLALPLGAAAIVARREHGAALRAWWPVAALAAAALVFAATSPYVLIDFGTFREHFGYEQQHLSLGQFGLAGTSSLAYYGRVLAGSFLGWPAALLALAGLTHGIARRRPAALILAAFLLPYLLVVNTWTLHAERYLLPALPLLLLFAAAGAKALLDLPRLRAFAAPARAGLAAALLLAAAAPSLLAYPGYLRSIGSDTRATSTRWIEANVPRGSLVVSELYGPELSGPQQTLSLPRAIGARAEALETRPDFGALLIPMYQVYPERTAPLYDLDLYAMADLLVTSDAVRGRYARDPAQFAAQCAFYARLDRDWERVADFAPTGGGPEIVVYRNPRWQTPFAERDAIPEPPALQLGPAGPTGSEATFYYEWGTVCEVYGQLVPAVDCYGLGLRYPVPRDSLYRALVLRRAACLIDLGRGQDALLWLEGLARAEQEPARADYLRWLRGQVESNL